MKKFIIEFLLGALLAIIIGIGLFLGCLFL